MESEMKSMMENKKNFEFKLTIMKNKLLLPLAIISMLSFSFTTKTNNKMEQTKNALAIEFGGRTKVNCHAKYREDLNKVFGEVLGLKIEKAERYDRVHFNGGGFVAFVYTDNENNLLNEEQFINAMQVGLLVDGSDYEEAKNRMKKFGIKEHYPPYIKNGDQSTFYYFHAPGGQVFRFVNKGKF